MPMQCKSRTAAAICLCKAEIQPVNLAAMERLQIGERRYEKDR